MIWMESIGCKSRVHCVSCRGDAAWRESLLKVGLVEVAEFDCVWGVTPETAQAVQDEALAKLPACDPDVVAKAKAQLEAQGRAAWLWLDTEAKTGTLTEERLKKEWWPMIPNYGCGCLKEAEELLKKIPFRQDDQYQWRVDFQNGINIKLGKPIYKL